MRRLDRPALRVAVACGRFGRPESTFAPKPFGPGITGGSGISGKWSGNGKQKGHWRDTDVLLEGPVIEQLQGAFVENWLEAPMDFENEVLATELRRALMTRAAVEERDLVPNPMPALRSVEMFSVG